MNQDQANDPSRRRVIAAGSAAAAVAAASSLTSTASAQGKSGPIRLGLVGCGGRGSGAAGQALKVGENIQLVAMGDAFEDRLSSSLENLVKQNGDQVNVADDMKFVGFDSYKKVIDQCDLVILATPPGFRPMMFEAAVEAGKDVFMEKPCAVDSAGTRKVLAAAKKADEKGLKVVAGLQRRYQDSYKEAYKKVHEEGLIGDIVSANVYWNSGGVWTRDRLDGMTEMEYQMTNWYYFNWLCGDHIVEQHVHNIDVANWFIGAHPDKAQGMGGREVRTGKENGEIYDHHAVEFRYPEGQVVSSQCRHQRDTLSQVREEIHGTKGSLFMSNKSGGFAEIKDRAGKVVWRHRVKEDPNPYEQEHRVLQAAIRGDEPINNAYYVAESTFTSILGRYATYTGKEQKWDDALADDVDLLPKNLAFDADPPVMPDADGSYEIAIPGKAGRDGRNPPPAEAKKPEAKKPGAKQGGNKKNNKA